MNTQLNLKLAGEKHRPKPASAESASWWFAQMYKTVNGTSDEPTPSPQTPYRIRAYPEVVIAKAMAQSRL